MGAALVLAHVVEVARADVPIWDESIYLGYGRSLVAGGAPIQIANAPGYAFLLGALSALFGPAGAVRAARVASTVGFGIAVGAVAFLVWRSSTAGLLAAVIALGSAHAFSPIGVQRTSMTLLLLGAVALASRRTRLGPGASCCAPWVPTWSGRSPRGRRRSCHSRSGGWRPSHGPLHGCFASHTRRRSQGS